MIQKWHKPNQGGYLSLNDVEWHFSIDSAHEDNEGERWSFIIWFYIMSKLVIMHRIYYIYSQHWLAFFLEAIHWCWCWDVFSKRKTTSSHIHTHTHRHTKVEATFPHSHRTSSFFLLANMFSRLFYWCCQGHQAFNNVDPNLRADLPRCSDGQPQSLWFL